MTGPKTVNWYTVYDARTDEIVACGTTEMVIQQMGYQSQNSFFSAITHARTRKGSKYLYYIEKISRKELENMQRKG